jgi:hypothetical protein
VYSCKATPVAKNGTGVKISKSQKSFRSPGFLLKAHASLNIIFFMFEAAFDKVPAASVRRRFVGSMISSESIKFRKFRRRPRELEPWAFPTRLVGSTAVLWTILDF